MPQLSILGSDEKFLSAPQTSRKSQVGMENLETLNQKMLEEQPLQSSHF